MFHAGKQAISTNAELAQKLDALEQKYDAQFKIVFDAIRKLMQPPESGRFRHVSSGA